MRKIWWNAMMAYTCGCLFGIGAVQAAGPDPATRCQSAKLRAIAQKASCLAQEAIDDASGRTGDTSRCEQMFTRSFTQAEEQAVKRGGACPTTGDAADIEGRLDKAVGGIAQLLSGSGRFQDNGDGTITDANTGLMWEKKDDAGGLHDKDNVYDWATATGSWINDINTEGGIGFAGRSDWRAPTVEELLSIVDYSRHDPAIDPAFNSGCAPSCTVTACSCTGAPAYWTASSTASSPGANAWNIDKNGFVDGNPKTSMLLIRAVRNMY